MGSHKHDSEQQYTREDDNEHSLNISDEESAGVISAEPRRHSQVFHQAKDTRSQFFVTAICISTTLIISFVLADEFTKAFVFARAQFASLRPKKQGESTKRIEYIETPYLIYRNAGMEALASRKKKLSKYFFGQALLESEKECGPLSFAKASELEHLYTASENWQEAGRYAELIVKNQLLLNGPRDPVLGDAYRMMASVCFKKGQPEQAMQLTRKAVAIYERACDPGSIKFEWLKSLEEKKSDYAVSLEPRTRHNEELPLGSWSKLPKAHFEQLAKIEGITYDSKDIADETKYKEAIELGEKNVQNGCDEQCTATIMNDYACFLRRLGRELEAKPIETKVDAIRAKHYGSLPPLSDK